MKVSAVLGIALLLGLQHWPSAAAAERWQPAGTQPNPIDLAAVESYPRHPQHPVVFPPGFGGLGVPSHPQALAWLAKYFNSSYGRWPEDWNATEWVGPSGVVGGGAACQGGSSEGGSRTAVRHAGAAAVGREGAVGGSGVVVLRRRARFLILSPVGDDWSPSRWLPEGEDSGAEYDLAVIYAGTNPNFSCPTCTRIFRKQGLKWELIRMLTKSSVWEEMAAQYRYVWFADDDLRIRSACDINQFFRTMEQYRLLMAQPSLCDLPGGMSTSWPWVVKQRPGLVLHYTSFVEVMGPAFDMDFFHSVIRHTLFNTNYGWGADFLWGALLKHPKRRVAIVDSVCMVHRKRSPDEVGDSIYSAPTSLPDNKAEWVISLEAFNHTTAYEEIQKNLRTYAEVRLLEGASEEAARKARQRQWALLGQATAGHALEVLASGGRPTLSALRLGLWTAAGVALLVLGLALLQRRRVRRRGGKGRGRGRGPKAGRPHLPASPAAATAAVAGAALTTLFAPAPSLSPHAAGWGPAGAAGAHAGAVPAAAAAVGGRRSQPQPQLPGPQASSAGQGQGQGRGASSAEQWAVAPTGSARPLRVVEGSRLRQLLSSLRGDGH